MDDTVHNRVSVHAAAEPSGASPSFCTVYIGRSIPSRSAARKAPAASPEQLVRPLERPLVARERAERPVLPQQLPFAAWPVATLAPEVLEVGLPYVAGSDSFGTGRLGERARGRSCRSRSDRRARRSRRTRRIRRSLALPPRPCQARAPRRFCSPYIPQGSFNGSNCGKAINSQSERSSLERTAISSVLNPCESNPN